MSSLNQAAPRPGHLDQHHQNPGEYQETRSMLERDEAVLVPGIVDLVGIGKRANGLYMDFGCGDGTALATYLLPPAASTGSLIYALDISNDMIQHASAAHKSPAAVNYVCGNILSETESENPVAGIQFDGIFALSVLQYLDPRSALARLCDHLKPGGRLGFMVPEAPGVFAVIQSLRTDPFWGPYSKNVHAVAEYKTADGQRDCSALESYLQLTNSLNLKVLKAECVPCKFYYEQLETYVRMTVAMNPFASKLEPELQKQLRLWYADGYLKFPQPETVLAQREKLTANGLVDKMQLPLEVVYNWVVFVVEK